MRSRPAITGQPWDDSIKDLARVPRTLLVDDRLEWTQTPIPFAQRKTYSSGFSG